MDHACLCRGVVSRGGPGMNSVIFGAVPELRLRCTKTPWGRRGQSLTRTLQPDHLRPLREHRGGHSRSRCRSRTLWSHVLPGLCRHAPVSEQRRVLFPSNFGTFGFALARGGGRHGFPPPAGEKGRDKRSRYASPALLRGAVAV